MIFSTLPFAMRLILILFLFTVSFSASNYDEVLKKIEAKDFVGAKPMLEAFVKSRWKTGEQEKAVVLYIETSIRLNNLNEAQRYAVQFLDFFPKSKYRDRVETALAILSILNKDPYNGAQILCRVLAYSKNPVAIARSRGLLLQLLSADLLSTNELQSLLDKGMNEKQTKALIQFNLGQKMQKENRFKAARYWYMEAKKSNPSLTEKAEDLIEKLEGKGAGLPVILVLAPLSGAYSELGNYMIQGILLYEDNLKNKVKIQIQDDRAEPVESLRKVKQALARDSVVAIIGPLLSASTATVSAWLGEKAPNIPLITPTATDYGISEMGRNIFQLNVSSVKLAASIADYAMRCLKINEFAIMAPLGDYGSLMASAFQRAVERRGGVVLLTQNYREGQPDYQNEFKLLRHRKLTLDTRRMNMSKGNSNVSSLNKRDSWLQDSTLTIPAVFIPSTNPEDAGLMAAQVSFNKLKVGNLLGSSGWYGRELLINAQKQAEGAFFSSAYSGNENEIKEFNNKFNAKWQTNPDASKVAGLSYDAIRIIESALQSNNSNLTNVILAKKEYNGVYGKIKFGSNRANESIEIISVEKGNLVEKPWECKVN